MSVGTGYSAVGESGITEFETETSDVEEVELEDLDDEEMEQADRLLDGETLGERPEFFPDDNESEVVISVDHYSRDDGQYLVSTEYTTVGNEVTRSIAFLLLLGGVVGVAYGVQYRDVERLEREIQQLRDEL